MSLSIADRLIGGVLGLVVVSFFLVGSVAGASHWTLPYDATITMCKIVDSNLVVVSTGTELKGVDLRSGAQLWTVPGISCRGNNDFGLIPGTPYAVATDEVVEEVRDERTHALYRKFHNRLIVLDYSTGEQKWNSDALGIYSVIGLYPLHQLGAIMVCGRDEELKYWMASVDLETGALTWENRDFFTDRDALVFRDPMADWTLDGNQLPVFDTDSTMLTLFNKRALRKWNARTGELIWESETGEKNAPTLRDGYALMILNDDHSIVYVPGDEVVHAFHTADGSSVWPDEPKLKGRVRQMELTDRGLFLKGGPGIDGKGGKHFVTMVNPQTGEELWLQPCTKFKRGKISQALVEQDTCFVYNDKRIFAVCLDDGSFTARGEELKIEGDDWEINLSRHERGFLLLSAQNLILVDPEGYPITHVRLKEPGTSFLLKAAAFTATVALNTLSAMYVQVPVYSTSTYMTYLYPTVNLMRFPQYGNSTDAPHYMYMLTNVEVDEGEEEQKGPGLAKVSKANGEIVGKIIVGDKSPMYSIDNSESLVVYVEDDTTVICADL